MDEAGFQKYLKRMGKQEHVVEELVGEAVCFEEYLSQHDSTFERASEQDISSFADLLEKRQPGRGRKMIRGIVLYYKYIGQDELAHAAHAIREQETAKTRKIFPLREFRGVDPQDIACLEAIGITNVEHMLAAGRTPEDRAQLSAKSGVSQQAILELVKLSDLSRLGAVKAVRARLYYDAGLDTPAKFVTWEPDALLLYLEAWVERTGFDGIAPLPKELRNAVEKARTLESIIEYE